MSKIKGKVIFDGAAAEAKGYEADTDLEFNVNDSGDLQSINLGGETFTIPQVGTKLYLHKLVFDASHDGTYMVLISKQQTQFTTVAEIAQGFLDGDVVSGYYHDTGAGSVGGVMTFMGVKYDYTELWFSTVELIAGSGTEKISISTISSLASYTVTEL